MSGSRIRGRTGAKAHSERARLHFPPGTILFDDEHSSQLLYFLRAGRVQLLSNRSAIVQYLAPGDVLGEESFLRGPIGNQAAKAVTPVTVDIYSKHEVLDSVQQDRRFAGKLLHGLAARIRSYEQTLTDFITVDAETRLARLLQRLLPLRPAAGWVRLPVSPSNLELAQSIGTTRWRVSHFLGKFQQLGWLRREQGFLVDAENLRRYLGKRHET
jgi:CRP-like cAMP-binding protein